MLKQQLTTKLFLIFLVTVSLVIACMLFMLNWSFKRDFSAYLNQSDASQLAPVVEHLEEYYAEHGSWDEIRQNPNIWRELTRPADRQSMPMERMPEPPHFRNGGFERPPRNNADFPQPPRQPPSNSMEAPARPFMPQTSSLEIGPRLSLFDSKEQLIIGRSMEINKLNNTPLHHDWSLIGWLSVAPVSTPAQSRDVAFLQQQANNLYIIAAVALSIAALVSLLLARRLLKPIRELASGAKSLTKGKYETQVKVHSHDELGQLASNFNMLANTLAANESARRRWIADISHELRTPLSVLRGEVEAMQDGVRPTNIDGLQSLHNEVGQLNKLVDDLYQLSLSDLGALNYQKAEQDVNEIIEQTCDSFRTRFNNANIDLQLKLNDKPLWSLVDAKRISQLLHNLLENTLRYTDSGGRLEVMTQAEAQQIYIDLHDSAPGVDKTELPHLFDPLYRVDASRNRAKGGAGLGLAIVRNIVTAHQGEIDAQPSHLGGLWIRISLPASPEERK